MKQKNKKWEKQTEQAGKRVYLLLYGNSKIEEEYEYTEWRADLEMAIYDLIQANLFQRTEEILEVLKKYNEENIMYADGGIEFSQGYIDALTQVQEEIKKRYAN